LNNIRIAAERAVLSAGELSIVEDWNQPPAPRSLRARRSRRRGSPRPRDRAAQEPRGDALRRDARGHARPARRRCAGAYAAASSTGRALQALALLPARPAGPTPGRARCWCTRAGSCSTR
jgi:hypothetical protein